MNQAQEYLSALVSLELSVRFAELEGRAVNSAVRACCAAVLVRIKDRTNICIVAGVAKQAFPAGAVAMLRRQLDAMVTNGKMD